VEAMFTVGGVSLIAVYLVWTAWRSKERVFGEERSSLETRPSGLDDAAILGGKPGESLAVVGLTCGLFGLLFFPPLFGTVGSVLGAAGYVKGSRRLGAVAVVAGAAALVLHRLV
jgi:hypothetical protein